MAKLIKLDDDWKFYPARLEIICPHGVGHYIPEAPRSTHGCDGCCDTDEFDQKLEKVRNDILKEVRFDEQD